MSTRSESDTMGSIEVPAEAYWGAQTQRSLENFAIGSETMPRPLIHAYGLLKQTAAEVNAELGELPGEIADLVARAAAEVATGRLDAHFPLKIWQTGSGTHTNMNVNEVIANRASEAAGGRRGEKAPVHPNDHVNRGQSTNDTFPTAIHVSLALALRDALFPAIDVLLATLDRQADRHADVIKIGRTHLQDATPLTLGQEIGAWASQLRLARRSIENCVPQLLELAVGGTAVGTGLNAHPRFGERVAAELARKTGLGFTSAPDKFAALAGHEALAALGGALATLAGALSKIANDVRWLGSGPRCGLGELALPANEPGSSIMPGKVNPSQAEALIMVCIQVVANQTGVTMAASQGNFQLNVCKPLLGYQLHQSITLLSDAGKSFEEHCVRGLEANREHIAQTLEQSLMLVTSLAPHIGYDEAARIAKKAHADGTSLREAALALGSVSAQQFDEWVRPERMLGPARPEERRART